MSRIDTRWCNIVMAALGVIAIHAGRLAFGTGAPSRAAKIPDQQVAPTQQTKNIVRDVTAPIAQKKDPLGVNVSPMEGTKAAIPRVSEVEGPNKGPIVGCGAPREEAKYEVDDFTTPEEREKRPFDLRVALIEGTKEEIGVLDGVQAPNNELSLTPSAPLNGMDDPVRHFTSLEAEEKQPIAQRVAPMQGIKTAIPGIIGLQGPNKEPLVSRPALREGAKSEVDDVTTPEELLKEPLRLRVAPIQGIKHEIHGMVGAQEADKDTPNLVRPAALEGIKVELTPIIDSAISKPKPTNRTPFQEGQR